MTLIKKENESHSNQIVVKQEKSQEFQYLKSEPHKKKESTSSKESRPALDEVSVNKKLAKQKENKDQKQKYLNYLLKTDALEILEDNKKANVNQFSYFNNQNTPDHYLKRDAESGEDYNKNKHTLTIYDSSNLTEDNNSHRSKKKLKNNPIENLKNISQESIRKNDLFELDTPKNANVIITDGNSTVAKKQICKSPGPYTPSKEYLYELAKTEQLSYAELKDIFNNINSEEEKDYVFDVSNMPLDVWVEEGQKNINEYTNLISELMKKRIELSIRFQTITELINARATALNDQGQLLDSKLKKIQEIGNEILNII